MKVSTICALILWSLFAEVISTCGSPTLQRIENTTLRMPQNPQSFGFKTENAFGTLSFSSPVAAKIAPGETNRLFIVEQGGRVYVITNLAAPSKTLFLDLTKRLSGDGFYAFTFDPGFATNGQFYAGYSTSTFYRLSRFTVSTDNANFASTNTELPLITQKNATCDDLLFGPDGYLYMSVLDPGADSGGGPSANHIDLDLVSGILRIDVHKRPGNLPPNPHPAATDNYLIPHDNPFIGATNFNGLPVDPAKVWTEFYAVGLRNPWRMSFDQLTGLLYVGDPGSSLRDEINQVVKGGNYGWPYREGAGPGPLSKKAPPGFTSLDPIHQYKNPSAVIGGLVYRGTLYPNLDGAYIFGDWVQNQLYAIRPAGTQPVSSQKICSQSGITAFAQDPRDGSILCVNHEQGRITRLIYSTNLVGSPLPATLADTGAFSDLTKLTPSPGIVPYELNVPFWSDNALKMRWFSVPNVKQTITFNRDSSWQFPTGTVWIKHFELELTNGVPESTRRLETRLLVRNATGVYGITYRWDDSQTNAALVAADGLDETFEIHDGASMRTQIWHYPARNECLTCHTPIAGLALGFNTAQLNRVHEYEGISQSQISALNDAGYFSTNITGLNTLPALASLTDTNISLDYRVHSYLAANCVQCHQPGGATRGQFDVRLSTPLSQSGLINGSLANNFADDENRVIAPGDLVHSVLFSRISVLGPDHMPPLATSLLNEPAAALLSAWITNSLPHPLLDQSVALAASLSNGQVQVQFTRPIDRAVEVQFAETLSGRWQALDLPGNNPIFSAVPAETRLIDSGAAHSTRFYRAQLLEP